MTIAHPWSIDYHDGNGNGYRFWQEGEDAYFEYTPVAPETSSSGIYSGGEPARGSMTTEQVRELRTRVDGLRVDQALHAEARSMGTGSFTVESDDGRGEFLVRAGAELAEFDAALAPYR